MEDGSLAKCKIARLNSKLVFDNQLEIAAKNLYLF